MESCWGYAYLREPSSFCAPHMETADKDGRHWRPSGHGILLPIRRFPKTRLLWKSWLSRTIFSSRQRLLKHRLARNQDADLPKKTLSTFHKLDVWTKVPVLSMASARCRYGNPGRWRNWPSKSVPPPRKTRPYIRWVGRPCLESAGPQQNRAWRWMSELWIRSSITLPPT